MHIFTGVAYEKFNCRVHVGHNWNLDKLKAIEITVSTRNSDLSMPVSYHNLHIFREET